MLAGANIIYGLGMLEMGMTISYSQLLMDAEMAEMMLFSMDGIVVNDETLLHFSYRRYLENVLRRSFDFSGTPIRIVTRNRNDNDAGITV